MAAKIFRTFRWIVSLSALTYMIVLVVSLRADNLWKDAVLQTVGPVLTIVGLLFVSVLLLLPEIVQLCLYPLHRMVDGLYFPGGRLDKPALTYKLPAHYERERRYEDALEEYLKIIRYYPQERPAYERAISLLVREFDDYSTARRLYHKALRRLRGHEQRRTIREFWRSLQVLATPSSETLFG